MPLALNPLNAAQPLTAFGTAGVFPVLFAETGLLIGFFLPGGSPLFTAGLLCTASGGGVHGRAITLARFIPVLAHTAAEPTVGSAK
ncbi:hypothetical protein ACPEIC_10605 [Stenotrophomonas sp. NPDC087984]